MKIQQIGYIRGGGQDGAIFGSELFRLDHQGQCGVYDLRAYLGGEERREPFATFSLGGTEVPVPHSNAVFFGTAYYEEGDPYPLLYSNVYNNCAGCENEWMGVCCVYRLQRNGNEFKSSPVQLIEIGFCEDPALWKVSEAGHGVRPWGNFLMDRETNSYYAFVMRNEALGTRYFKFDMPSAHAGEWDSALGLRRVVLHPEDIREQFDLSYCRFIQGAALHNGCIYVTEGFSGDRVNRPAIRIIDLKEKRETYFDIMKMGLSEEPEMIDFFGDVCYYSDSHGRLYRVDFSQRMRVREKINMELPDLIRHGAITIVALGDSVTHGALNFGEIDYESVYWNRLRKKINQRRDYVPVNVINAGIGATSARQGLERLDGQVLIHDPDLVIVCFALNDVNGSLENYLAALRGIFAKLLQSGTEVIFMTPNMLNTYVAEDLPQLYREYAAKMANIQNGGKMDQFVSAAIELCGEMGVAVCDCYAEWKRRSEHEDTTLLLANRINHPTREMHELFAERLYAIIFDEAVTTASEESTMWREET